MAAPPQNPALVNARDMEPPNKSLQPNPRSRHHGILTSAGCGFGAHRALGWRGPLSSSVSATCGRRSR